VTPSWPQLAGWLATPRVRTLRCSWYAREGHREASGSVAYDAEQNLWSVVDEAGAPSRIRLRSLLMPSPFESDDFHLAAEPVVAVEHDDRPCWEVALLPPPHKRGLLRLVVDDATGLCLQQRNDEHNWVEQVTNVEVDVSLPDKLLEPARRQREADKRSGELRHLLEQRPVPTPRWFPWRLDSVDHAGGRSLAAVLGGGMVSRAPLGKPPPVGDWWDEADVVRLDARGWSWAVAARPRLDAATARRVVDEVVDGRPYD